MDTLNIPTDALVTYTGARFSLVDQSTWVFDIQDIAKSLSNMCRYNGHVEFYSVAEHLVRVANHLRDDGYPNRTQLRGLLHDAHEAYTSDVPSPFKPLITINGVPLKQVEDQITSAINTQFGILDRYEPNEPIERADDLVFLMEYAERPHVGRGLSPAMAQSEFLRTFYRLCDS
jgi:5'-deoxynucleotidase YfbR-like HD superfamily hydrolase